MRVAIPILALAVLLHEASTAAAVDLSKASRAIKKEPAYKSKPRYCLMVFGPEAKHRVWLGLDGDTLYVDENGAGDLTGPGERVRGPAFTPSDHPAHEAERSIAVGDLTVAGLTHAKLEIGQIRYRKKVDTSRGTGLSSA